MVMRNYLNPTSYICGGCHKMISVKNKWKYQLKCVGDMERKRERKQMRRMIKEKKEDKR